MRTQVLPSNSNIMVVPDVQTAPNPCNYVLGHTPDIIIVSSESDGKVKDSYSLA